MSYTPETESERSRRIRNRYIATILCFGWWFVSIGGIIYVINSST